MGGYLAKLAVNEGHSVLGIDTKEPDASAFAGKFERYDVRDTAKISETITAFQPERIFTWLRKVIPRFRCSAAGHDADQRGRNHQHF